MSAPTKLKLLWPAMPASPIASNYPLIEWWAPLAVNGTRAPLQRKLRDQPKLARKAPKTYRSPKCCIWVIYMPTTYLPSLPHSPGHSRDSGLSPAQLPTSRNPPGIQFTWLFQQKKQLEMCQNFTNPRSSVAEFSYFKFSEYIVIDQLFSSYWW